MRKQYKSGNSGQREVLVYLENNRGWRHYSGGEKRNHWLIANMSFATKHTAGKRTDRHKIYSKKSSSI
jgi:hypothetical protein